MLPVACAHCGNPATFTRPGRYCAARCRVAASRERQAARSAAASAHAELALLRGDVTALEAAARRTIALLNPSA